MTLASGSTLGPYTIRAELGHGGMGVVYTAHDPRLKRQVAIKLLTADLTRDGTAKQRFLQEAEAASALDHPNICTIFEINETDDGQLYLVRGALAVDEAVDIARQIADGEIYFDDELVRRDGRFVTADLEALNPELLR